MFDMFTVKTLRVSYKLVVSLIIWYVYFEKGEGGGGTKYALDVIYW